MALPAATRMAVGCILYRRGQGEDQASQGDRACDPARSLPEGLGPSPTPACMGSCLGDSWVLLHLAGAL